MAPPKVLRHASSDGPSCLQYRSEVSQCSMLRFARTGLCARYLLVQLQEQVIGYQKLYFSQAKYKTRVPESGKGALASLSILNLARRAHPVPRAAEVRSGVNWAGQSSVRL